ncbi:hypothetical protein AYO38_02575 [bacterium SCGC AG-212-C10]|nr:hypothetical protein AYO38_02575 [bacterium SCGC AG-212-C10]
MPDSTYKLVHMVDGHMQAERLTFAAIEALGYPLVGAVEPRSGRYTVRAELQGQPKFAGPLGPMWDGDCIRYEDVETYRTLSA